MEKILMFLGVLAVLLIACVVVAFPVMWLVNELFSPSFINSVFGVSQIGFSTALGLSVLCSLLFKSHSTAKD